MDLQHFWQEKQLQVNRALEKLLPQASSDLHKAMSYAVFNGGKRFRPLLVYATAQSLNFNNQIILDTIAAAIECMHSYSLVHDDLPAMDDDDLRRGKASCHIAFDEATAILCGDALQCFSFELLSQIPLPAEKITQLIRTLCAAVGPFGMALGQHYDLLGQCKSANDLRTLHELKTGKLIEASVIMAYIASGACKPEYHQCLKNYAYHLGVAFQICDDILDCTKTSQELGKPANSDQKNEKVTYVSFYGLVKAKSMAETEIYKAKDAIAKIDLNNNYLVELADLFINRCY